MSVITVTPRHRLRVPRHYAAVWHGRKKVTQGARQCARIRRIGITRQPGRPSLCYRALALHTLHNHVGAQNQARAPSGVSTAAKTQTAKTWIRITSEAVEHVDVALVGDTTICIEGARVANEARHGTRTGKRKLLEGFRRAGSGRVEKGH